MSSLFVETDNVSKLSNGPLTVLAIPKVSREKIAPTMNHVPYEHGPYDESVFRGLINI